AYLAHFVAQRDDPVESCTGEAAEVLGRSSGNVDAALGHRPYRVRMQRLGMAAGATGADGPTRQVLEEGLGHLGPGAVPGTEEQHDRRPAPLGPGRLGGEHAQ